MIPIELYCGDCLKIMENIPDKSVDMVLCDLPFGTTQNRWDVVIDPVRMFAEYRRIVKIGGVMALFSQPPFNAVLMTAGKVLFRYEWIWQKSQGTGFLNANRMPLKIHENILIFYDKLGTYNPQYTEGESYKKSCKTWSTNYRKMSLHTTVSDGRRYPVDVITFTQANCEKGKVIYHPTQKPVPLLEYLIKTYTNEGETVLDNCMGSGSTGVACINTDRNFIGIEKDEKYFGIAKDRIENHVKGDSERVREVDENQLTMF